MQKQDTTAILALKKKHLHLKVCKGFFSRTKGLMFAKKPRPTLLICPKTSIKHAGIHMFFVFFPLEIRWYDSKLKEIERKIVRPFTGSHYPKKPAKYVLELPTKHNRNLYK